MTAEELEPGFGHRNYEISDAARIAIVEERLLAPHQDQISGRVMCFQVDDPHLEDVARSVECDVFSDYFNEDSQKLAEIYGPYEQASRFFLSVDCQTGQPVGALRVIENSSAGLMTLNDAPVDAHVPPADEVYKNYGVNDRKTCWDVGTVAVLPEFRKYEDHIVSMQLYRAMYMVALNEEIEHMFAIIDQRPLKTMQRFLGIPLERMQGTVPFRFGGSKESEAVHGYFPDFYRKINRRRYTSGFMARKALSRMIDGTIDDTIVLQ